MTKICCVCKRAKDVSAFCKNRHRKDKLNARCRACVAIFQATKGKDGLTRQQRRDKKPGRDGLTRSQRAHAKNPEKARRHHLKHKYGITPEEFQRLSAAQGGACAICNCPSKKLHVDHNHSTGKIRALLCNNCNVALGYLNDSAKVALAASVYLVKHGNP